MKKCTECGTTDPKRFVNTELKNHSTYCKRCTELYRKSGRMKVRNETNAKILKGLRDAI